MASNSANTETASIRLVVDQHYLWQPEAPELFHWEQVINPKQANIALALVQEIRDRQAEWAIDQQKGTDPVIEGLRLALRIVARQAVWRVQSEERLRVNEATRLGSQNAYPVPIEPGGELRNLQVSALR